MDGSLDTARLGKLLDGSAPRDAVEPMPAESFESAAVADPPV
jgi:hypothetical protein